MVAVLNAGVFTVRSVLVVVVRVQIAHVKLLFGSGFFHRVHDPVGHQARNMLVGERVEDMLAFAPGTDDPFALEQTQAL